MKNIRTIILLAVLLGLFPYFANAQQSNSKEDAVIIAKGVGATKDEAATVALRNAIAEVYGVFVSSNTVLLNDELIKDEIASTTNGNIRKYRVISEEYKDGQCHVVVEAAITVQKLISFCKQKGISEVKIDGSSFLMNQKIKEINEKNEAKAREIRRENDKRLLVQAFDCTIEKISEPTKGETYYYICVQLSITSNKNYYLVNPWDGSLQVLTCEDVYYALSQCIRLSDNLGNEYGFSLERKKVTGYSDGTFNIGEFDNWDGKRYKKCLVGSNRCYVKFHYYDDHHQYYYNSFFPKKINWRCDFYLYFTEEELGKLTEIRLVQNNN